jgi:hypothetical protein
MNRLFVLRNVSEIEIPAPLIELRPEELRLLETEALR